MSPERLIRRSNRGVDYIIGQGYYNLVSFPSPSLTHNRSDKRERPCAQSCRALLWRFRFRCDLVLLPPRVYGCPAQDSPAAVPRLVDDVWACAATIS